MFINKLNQLYKPKRTLYYIDASKEDIVSFYKGVIPPLVEKYADSFGTYDWPGVFFFRQLQKEVIGIEFRSGDPCIDYPTEMKSIELDAAFYPLSARRPLPLRWGMNCTSLPNVHKTVM